MTKRIDDTQLERLRVILAHTTYEMHGLVPATRPPQDKVLVARGLLREYTLQTIVTDAIIDTDGSAAGQTIAWSRPYVTLTPMALDFLLDEVTAANRQIVMELCSSDMMNMRFFGDTLIDLTFTCTSYCLTIWSFACLVLRPSVLDHHLTANQPSTRCGDDLQCLPSTESSRA